MRRLTSAHSAGAPTHLDSTSAEHVRAHPIRHTREATMPTPPFTLSPDLTLADWQADAVDRWRRSRHPTLGPRHGIIEAVTGTGKTLAAIACIADAVAEVASLRVAVVVPSQQLARQWAAELRRHLTLPPDQVGLRMTGHRDSLRHHRVVVWVIDSARRSLATDCRGHDVMLVVDECHRSGSTKNRRIFDAETRFRLGLSATAQRRGEVGDDGLVLPLERQPHARALGPTFVKLSVARAEALGILPPFRLVHHGLSLTEKEQATYHGLCRGVREALAEASQLGLSAGAVQAAVAAGAGGRFSAQQVQAAKAVQAATLARKHFLYLRPERARVASLLVAEALHERAAGAQVLLFHERIAATKPKPTADDGDREAPRRGEDPMAGATERAATMGAEGLFRNLRDLADAGALPLAGAPDIAIRRHHSEHPDPEAFVDMRRPFDDPKRAQVLVSVKSAVEGVDLPNADVGVVVASSSSVRQRIQTLGRILRPLRGADGRPMPRDAYEGLPPRTLHLLYVHGTVDADIYQQTDWEELLGPDRNTFVRWELGAEQPHPDEAPPEPPPTDAEAAAWALSALEDSAGMPVPWPGRRPSADVQPLVYRRNAVRALRGGPAIEGGGEIARVVQEAAELLEIPPMDLRGDLLLRLEDGLVIRAAPRSLGELLPVALPGRERPVPIRWLVLGRCRGAALPRG